MNKLIRLVKSFIAALAVVFIGMAGIINTTFAHPVAQADDPVAMIMALADAYNNGNVAKLREMLDPSFQTVTENAPAYWPPEFTTQNLEQFIESSTHGTHVTLSNCQRTAPDMATCDVVISGGDLPPLPHPYTEQTTITVRNGKAVRLADRVSEQTLADIMAFIAAQPGMPTTGSINVGLLFGVPALALSVFAMGVLLRRIRFVPR